MTEITREGDSEIVGEGAIACLSPASYISSHCSGCVQA